MLRFISVGPHCFFRQGQGRLGWQRDGPEQIVLTTGEGTAVAVRLLLTPDGRTRLEVTDPGPHTWLIARTPSAHDETGRALLLLDAVARR